MEATIVKIVLFLTSLSFFGVLLAPVFTFITIESLGWFSGATIAVAGVCVVATGIPCAAAIAIYTAVTFLTTYFSSVFSWITTLILTPISIILVLYIAKVARAH